MSTKAEREIAHKLKVFEHAKQCGNVSFTCRYFGISRDTFYRWMQNYKKKGEKGLINSKPCPENPKLRAPQNIVDKIIEVRKEFCLGDKKISWYLKTYYNMNISPSGVYVILKRHGLNRLPRNMRKRSKRPVIRYEKKVPGHHVQVDVKFVTLRDTNGRLVRRYQYTAIDDATRIRALKIYDRHNQANAIDFINHIVDKFPFRIHTVQTDNGHEFNTKFHWHLHDIGINHRYIRAMSPHLNGKVERSHRTDKEEFYQLITYTNDKDLDALLNEWEHFYNFFRPHASLGYQTPFERLKVRMEPFMPDDLRARMGLTEL